MLRELTIGEMTRILEVECRRLGLTPEQAGRLSERATVRNRDQADVTPGLVRRMAGAIRRTDDAG